MPDPETGSPLLTVRRVLRDAVHALEAVGVDAAPLDARVLLAEALGVERTALITYPDRALTAEEAAAFDALVRRRAAREPVSHILGRREFWSLPFKVTSATLVPRPDSETLVAAAFEHIKGRGLCGAPLRLLDLGTGTGCLILALLSELPAATGVGVERSPEAACVAEENATALGLANRFRLVVGDWTDALDEGERFDLIVSNPPYIPDAEFERLDADVAHYEPALALKGGADGLDAYRRLLPGAVKHLVEGGALVLEIGAGQGHAVQGLCRESGLHNVRVVQDLAGRDRVVVALESEKVAKPAK